MKRARLTGDAAVYRTVNDLVNKFEYPEPEFQAPPPLLTGGGGAPTVVVAASDSTDFSKSKADFQCTGSNDNAVIDAAIDALAFQITSSFFSRGRVILCEGTFSTTSVISVPSGVMILGLGSAATSVEADGVTAFACIGNTEMRSMQITGGGAGAIALSSSGRSTIADCSFYGSSWGVRKSGAAFLTIVRCLFDDNTDGITFAAGTGNHTQIRDCYFTANGNGIDLPSGASNWDVTVSGNRFVSQTGYAIDLEWAQRWVITDNRFLDNTGDIILNASATQNVIANNTSMTCADAPAIHVQGNRNVVSANNITLAERHGLLIEGDENKVGGNGVYESGTDTADTYDNINVDGDGNQIQGNLVTPNTPGNATRYGLNIASGNNNVAFANSLGDASVYGTDDFVDAGTGTITTPNGDGQFSY